MNNTTSTNDSISAPIDAGADAIGKDPLDGALLDKAARTDGAQRGAPLKMAQKNRHRPYLVVSTIVLAVGGVVALMADSSGFEYYKHVDEVAAHPEQWRNKRLQMHGFVVPGSIAKRIDLDHQKLEYKFRAENCGAVVDVRFAGVVPDTFKDGAEVVLKGEWKGDQFQSTEVMAKCPSKYAQAGEAQSAMVTRCARDAQSQANTANMPSVTGVAPSTSYAAPAVNPANMPGAGAPKGVGDQKGDR